MRQFELWVPLEDRCKFSGQTLFLGADSVTLPTDVLAHILVERPITPRSTDPNVADDMSRSGWAVVQFSS
ncbi:hypothetical protein J2854_001657 [Agrobacterium tumefaciens]|nr:hypothetical protein [Agrobacterium tumefaciens]